MNGVNGGLLGPRRDPFGGLGVTTTLERALVVGTDSSFANVELLLPMTGSNSGTTFTDVSSKNYAITRTGAVTSTTRWPFTGSGSSGLFNGTSDYLTVGSAADWKFLHDASTDHTVEAFIYVTDNTSATFAGTAAASADIGFTFSVESGDLYYSFYRGVGGSLFVTTSTGALVTVNTWHHVAAVLQFIKAGATTLATATLYLNGSNVASAAASSFAFSSSNPTYTLNIGRYPFTTPGGYLPGNISNLRITKQARYTGNFTAPTMPLFAR